MWVTCVRLVVFSGYSAFLHDITEIWLKVLLNTITLATVFPNTLLFQYYDFKVHCLLVSIRTFNNHGIVQLFMTTLIVILTVIACCLFELKRIYPRFTMYCSILYFCLRKFSHHEWVIWELINGLSSQQSYVYTKRLHTFDVQDRNFN